MIMFITIDINQIFSSKDCPDRLEFLEKEAQEDLRVNDKFFYLINNLSKEKI